MATAPQPIEDDQFEHGAFISYNRRASHKVAGLLYEALQRKSLSPWLDRRIISGGDNFFSDIVQGIERSACVVALITPRSLKSQWCNGEIFLGHAYDAIIPVHCGVSWNKVPYGISTLDPIQFRSERDIQAIVDSVEKFNAKRRSRTGFGGAPFPTSSGRTTGFLRALNQWPPEGAQHFEALEDFRRAEKTIEGLNLPGCREAMAAFNEPARIQDGLLGLLECLEENQVEQNVWRAFATLAQPFVPHLAAHGLTRARANSKEFTALLGATREEIVRELTTTPAEAEATEEYIQTKASVLNAIAPSPPPPPPAITPEAFPTATARPPISDSFGQTVKFQPEREWSAARLWLTVIGLLSVEIIVVLLAVTTLVGVVWYAIVGRGADPQQRKHPLRFQRQHQLRLRPHRPRWRNPHRQSNSL